jgi:hypothetical protein
LYRLVKVAITIVGISMFGVGSGYATEQTAEEFLKSLQGEFAGRGNAIVIGDRAQRIACKISSVFDDSTSVLNVTGECAGTKGKSKINGDVAAAGDKVKGSFLSPRKGMTVTQSFGSFEGDSMQLLTSMVDENAGRLVKIRQVISKTDEGINAQFFTYSNSSKSYEPTGEIALKAKATAEEQD